MDNLDVICIGAAIVDIPLQPVSKNIFDVDSYPLERIAMTTGGDAINEATIISRLGHRTALMSRVGKDAAGQFILDHCRKENIDIQSLKQDVSIDTSIKEGANKRGNSSRLTQSFHFFMFEPIFSPVNALNQPI